MSKSINPLHILENIPEGVFAINRECRITYFNQRAEEITGYAREQALGKTCHEVFRPEICQSTCSIKQSMATGKESFDQQVNVLNRFNRPLSIRIQTSPLRDDGGCIVGGLQTFHVIDRPDEEIRKELVLFELRKKMGRDRRLARTFEILPDLARSGAPVLLQGEPGTGKQLLAGAIHRLSGRASGPFFSVSCKEKSGEELSEEILGSNFNSMEGEQKPEGKGILEKAHRGTIFLDGIECLPYPLQVSLFRAMEEGVYMPVGGTTPLDSDIRLIASTEFDLEEKVKEGTFRENLFYCLNVFKIHVPPLRDRKEDIPLLSRDIIWHLNLEEGKEVHELDGAAVRLLQTHAFPNNLRELAGILERAYRSTPHPTLTAEDLRSFLTARTGGTEAPPSSRKTPNAPGREERQIILAALMRNQWSRKRAARELGMDRTTLWRKMKRMGIQSAVPNAGKEENK